MVLVVEEEVVVAAAANPKQTTRTAKSSTCNIRLEMDPFNTFDNEDEFGGLLSWLVAVGVNDQLSGLGDSGTNGHYASNFSLCYIRKGLMQNLL